MYTIRTSCIMLTHHFNTNHSTCNLISKTSQFLAMHCGINLGRLGERDRLYVSHHLHACHQCNLISALSVDIFPVHIVFLVWSIQLARTYSTSIYKVTLGMPFIMKSLLTLYVTKMNYMFWKHNTIVLCVQNIYFIFSWCHSQDCR